MNKSCQVIIENIVSFYPIPIPLMEIAEDEGIRVIFDDYGTNTFDGMTWYEAEQEMFYMHINTARNNGKNNTKGRFTLAHELGHYFIDHHRRALQNGIMSPHIHRYEPFGKNEDWLIEREADEFAANLLMPTTQFKSDFAGKVLSGELVKSVADKYNVSFSACALRYLKFNIIPIMLVFSQNGKVKWQMRSADFPFYRLKYGKDKVSENTVMGDYFINHDESCCKQDEIVYAGDCFDTYEEEQNRLVFFEYCIAYKNYAFSMLWEKDSLII